MKQTVIRGTAAVIVVLLCFAMLIWRLAELQLIDKDDLKNQAITQYTMETVISAKRGYIYDRNMEKIFAKSKTVYNVIVSPKEINNLDQVSKDESAAEQTRTAQETRDILVKGLAEILGVSEDNIRERLTKTNSYYQVIKRTISDEEETKMRAFMTKYHFVNEVYLEETSKRYYPYSSLASQVVGFVASDNKGLEGVELTCNEVLAGINGRSVTGKDGNGNPLSFDLDSYIEAQDGQNIVMTIDWTIQSILEKYLKECYDENLPTFGCRGIIMDVNTGEILGMANYPDYDLNNRNDLNPVYQEKYDAFEGSEEEKAAYLTELLYDMRKNKTVTDLYDPGSTFKIITAAMALEEGVYQVSDHFECVGSINVAGVLINCHKLVGHGDQTFAEALVNSCNPAFVMMGQRIGAETFAKYFEAFGYTTTTGSDIAGEAKSIYIKDLGNLVDLANVSFGQSMSITPLQHIRAVSTIANGGYLVTPHIIKGYADSNGNMVYTTNYENARQVISETTANTILSILVNSTKNAAVSGYNIASKTGTSTKQFRENAVEDMTYYISSCVSFAPAEDPEIAILIIVDEPTGEQFYGSQVAAPVVGNILTEVLPYLKIEPNSENSVTTLRMQEYLGKEVESARYALEKLGLKCVVRGNGTVVTGQMPRVGSTITEGGTVILYTGDATASKSITLANFTGMTPTQVIAWCESNQINYVLDGVYNKEYANCYAIAQSIEKYEAVEPATIVTVTFKYNEEIQ